ncbi:hypothetical protein F2P81_013734 [Scophthalmus maximus]|uniref:Uncharacterized protein n=1 Tax=Scophthalmus maximus TaxID=52904 RepID=A0A6A4SNC1_SCOMX|nr:hypothetical protein F2P81_013734 [Scophthalmus maximus]
MAAAAAGSAKNMVGGSDNSSSDSSDDDEARRRCREAVWETRAVAHKGSVGLLVSLVVTDDVTGGAQLNKVV